ncbi:MAG: sigma-70 family RNA polymerase sigma factor [Saprospiraceae bacterium]|nr:sigma-70 family RNA polymerase sigma factor [Saprospiraceae bacterium]
MLENHKKTELTNWVQLYTGYLYAWAIKKTSDHQLSEDLVQETFLAAAESYTSFKAESHPKTWLIGILKNKIAGHYRQTIRQNISTANSDADIADYFGPDGRWQVTSPAQSWLQDSNHLMDLPAFTKIFSSCIDHLPALMNSCIRLKFLDEKKGEQICQELGITTTNYWQLIHRAKLQLRDCLDKFWFSKV